MIKIAIDGMGGDNAPSITAQGVTLAIQANAALECIVYGDQAVLKPLLGDTPRVQIVHTS